MGIKAIFPPGVTELIVNGLHQWDYGRKLEIYSDDLSAEIEVHFACAGMDEATVRCCNVTLGVAKAVIPDMCLEQTSPIKAWVYEIGTTSGVTTKTITLTVTPRAKPQASEFTPDEYSDKYTELIAAVNEQVATLKEGKVAVNRALTADKALKADNVTLANKASMVALSVHNSDAYSSTTIDDKGLYLVAWKLGTTNICSMLYVPDMTQIATVAHDGYSVSYNPQNSRITVAGSDGGVEEKIQVFLVGS